MRILHAVGWYFPHSVGGTEQYVRALAREQQRRGHTVTIAVPRAAYDTVASWEHEGVAVHAWPVSSHPTRAEAQGRASGPGLIAFATLLRDLKPQVVHVHSQVTGLGDAEVREARASGARVLLTLHTPGLGYHCLRGTLLELGTRPCDGHVAPQRCARCLLEQRGVGPAWRDVLARLPMSTRHLPGRIGSALGMRGVVRLAQRRQRALLRDAHVTFVLTGAAREMLLAAGAAPDAVRVSPLGVADELLVPTTRPPEAPTLRVGFVARFDPIKGARVLADAVRQLPRDVPIAVDFHGVCQGPADDAEAADVEALARDDARVRRLPPVARKDIARVLANFDVLCCPSLAFEGGPTVALEAMAVGTPVIGSRMGGLREHVRDGVTGALVPPGDHAALAGVLRRCARDRSLVQRWRDALPRPRTMADVCDDVDRVLPPA